MLSAKLQPLPAVLARNCGWTGRFCQAPQSRKLRGSELELCGRLLAGFSDAMVRDLVEGGRARSLAGLAG